MTLSSGARLGLYEIDQYDVAPDGRFVVVRPEPLPPVTQLHLVQSWHEELKRLVPIR